LIGSGNFVQQKKAAQSEEHDSALADAHVLRDLMHVSAKKHGTHQLGEVPWKAEITGGMAGCEDVLTQFASPAQSSRSSGEQITPAISFVNERRLTETKIAHK